MKKSVIITLFSACRKSHILLRGRPLVQGVPSPKTVHRTVFEFTPCGAFSGYMWGFAPHPTRAVSPWPDQRDVIPLETRCLSFRLDSNFLYSLNGWRLCLFWICSKLSNRQPISDTYNVNYCDPFNILLSDQKILQINKKAHAIAWALICLGITELMT